MAIEQRIYNLVKEQFEKMTLSKTFSNQAKLANICQNIICNEWGFTNNNLWNLVDKYVKEFITDDMD